MINYIEGILDQWSSYSKGKGKGKGWDSYHSTRLYLCVLWNQIAQMESRRKHNQMSKMESVSIHSHDTSLHFLYGFFLFGRHFVDSECKFGCFICGLASAPLLIPSSSTCIWCSSFHCFLSAINKNTFLFYLWAGVHSITISRKWIGVLYFVYQSISVQQYKIYIRKQDLANLITVA